MDELIVGLAIVDQMNGGHGMRAIYERMGDEPRRPVRRRLAATLRFLAARLAPLPQVPVAEPRASLGQVVPAEPAG